MSPAAKYTAGATVPSARPVVKLWARPVTEVAGLVNVTWCGRAQPFTGEAQVSVFGCSLQGSPAGPERAPSASGLQGQGLRAQNQSGGGSALEFVGVLSLNPCVFQTEPVPSLMPDTPGTTIPSPPGKELGAQDKRGAGVIASFLKDRFIDHLRRVKLTLSREFCEF